MIRVYYLGTETPVKFSDLDSHTVRARDIDKKASRQTRRQERWSIAKENNGQKKQNLYCRLENEKHVKNESLNVVTVYCADLEIQQCFCFTG